MATYDQDERHPLPTYISYEEGISDVSGFDECRPYLKEVMRTYVRDTPFKQTDIYDLHERLQDVEGAHIPFERSTVRRELLRMRKEGLIVIFDRYSERKENRVFYWKESIPELEPEPDPTRIKTGPSLEDPVSLSPELKENNPLTAFFEALLQDTFS